MPAKRTKEQQAAYMREYRARKRAEQDAMQQVRERALATGSAVLSGVSRGGDPEVAPDASPDGGPASQGPSPVDRGSVSTTRSHSTTPMRGVRVGEGPDAPPLVHPTAGGGVAVSSVPPSAPRPSFLAAPDDDCVCGHDRHAYHLTGPCTAYIRPKTKCPCTGFMADLGFE